MQTVTHDFFHVVLFLGKVAGTLSAIGGIGYAGARVLGAFYSKVKSISSNVDLLMTNHLPHLADAVDGMRKDFTGVKSDVRDLDTKVSGISTRMEDTRKSLDSFGQAFIQHLEHGREAVAAEPASEEKPARPRRKHVARETATLSA